MKTFTIRQALLGVWSALGGATALAGRAALGTLGRWRAGWAVAAGLVGAWVIACLPPALHAQTVETMISSNLAEPYGIAVDPNNLYYITDSANNRIVRYNPDTGLLTNFVGLSFSQGGYADGVTADARFYSPQGIVFVAARSNSFVVADSGNQLLRLVTLDGIVSTLAGAPLVADWQDGVGAAARFSAPAGLAADTNGNVFIADLQNNRVRRLALDGSVTTVAAGFYRPAAVAVGGDGRLYVTDTGNNSITVVRDRMGTNQSAVLVAGSGSRALPGYQDSPDAASARFDNPNSLLWIGGNVGWLIGDSGNHVLRRMYTNVAGTYSVDTFAPSVGADLVNPAGLARDLTGSILIADTGSNTVRRIQTTQAAQPPVQNPVIGFIVLTNNLTGPPTTLLTAVTNSTFNNETVIGILAEPGTQTYYTIAKTDLTAGTPDPTVNDAQAHPYSDGAFTLPPSILIPTQPDVTIKAIGTQSGRKPSQVVTARFRFQVANPVIHGLNVASFTLDTATVGAQLWYTVDGTDPAPSPPAHLYADGTRLNALNGTKDVVFKAQGFKSGFQASALVQQTFTYTNFLTLASRLGFTSDFKAGTGATVLIPVEVALAIDDVFQSLQYRIEVSPIGAAPPVTAPMSVIPSGTNDFISLPTATGSPTAITNLLAGPGSPTNVLGVAYVGAGSGFNVARSGPVTVIALTIPASAHVGDRYRITITEPTATRDGVQDAVAVNPMDARTILVTNLSYVVGDTAPASWYNAGDFGDGNLQNSDVNNAFLASLGIRVPYPFSDVFDAMDAFPEDTAQTRGGDGQIRFLDWQTTLRRSLLFATNNWRRAWSTNGVRLASPAGALGSAFSPAAVLSASSASPPVWSRPVRVSAGTIANAAPDAVVLVPIYVTLLNGTANVVGGQIRPVVSLKLDASDSEVPFTFVANADQKMPTPNGQAVPAGTVIQGLGYTTTNNVLQTTNNLAFVWSLGAFSPPLAGVSNLIGWLQFRVPSTAVAGSQYLVRFANADLASSNAGQWGQLDAETVPGVVWVHSPASSASPLVPDEWKTNFFASLTAPETAESADPDGDGLSNLGEYLANTNPVRPDWRVTAQVTQAGTVVTWFAEPGKTYAVFTAESVPTTNWVQISASLPGLSYQWQSFTSTSLSPNTRFYRVAVLP